MLRRSGAGRLHSATQRQEEDVNPMESTTNLSDVMLVLAVGMMLAVVINWNVDINKNTVKKIDDPHQVNSNQISEDGFEQNLVEKGKVYYDEDTGQYYVKVD
ncbi:MAG: DUF2149 domain-containing protein [Firmicutes bacterium]|nr:DUF2149 domain-containing protein [Bacillota bacterium]